VISSSPRAEGRSRNAHVDDLVVVEIKPSHRIVGARLGRLLLQAGDPASIIEAHDAIALRVAHAVGEHRGAHASRRCALEERREPSALEEIIAQDEAGGAAGKKVARDDDRLRNSVGLILLGIAKPDPPLASISQQRPELAPVNPAWR
jgi:hypothetical protein